MVVTYCQTGSPTETLKRFRVQFTNIRVPTGHTVTNNYQKDLDHGTSTKRNAGNSGQDRTVNTRVNML